jgi:anti-sigma regulatory factor (Ser/Thr protein kinase)
MKAPVMPHISLPANISQLSKVNSFLAQNIPEKGISLLPRIGLAVEELLVNIFRHAHRGG